MASEHEHTDHELAFPFVVCASQGGPRDDQASVQGVNLGLAIARMEYGENDATAYVHPGTWYVRSTWRRCTSDTRWRPSRGCGRAQHTGRTRERTS